MTEIIHKDITFALNEALYQTSRYLWMVQTLWICLIYILCVDQSVLAYRDVVMLSVILTFRVGEL